jgi:hypothetical protein
METPSGKKPAHERAAKIKNRPAKSADKSAGKGTKKTRSRRSSRKDQKTASRFPAAPVYNKVAEKVRPNMPIAEAIDGLKAWQESSRLIPFTCANSFLHPKLVPEERDDEVVLTCKACNYVQENIPHFPTRAEVEANEKRMDWLVHDEPSSR